LVAFFCAAGFFAAAFGFVAFLAAAGFFVAVDFGFFGVVAFLAFGLTAFFGDAAFFAPVDLAALVFFATACVGFFVFAALADFAFELDRDVVALAIVTFFGLSAVVVAEAVAALVVVVELFVLAAVATFLADLGPADFERARFFVPDAAELDAEVVFFCFS